MNEKTDPNEELNQKKWEKINIALNKAGKLNQFEECYKQAEDCGLQLSKNEFYDQYYFKNHMQEENPGRWFMHAKQIEDKLIEIKDTLIEIKDTLIDNKNVRLIDLSQCDNADKLVRAIQQENPKAANEYSNLLEKIKKEVVLDNLNELDLDSDMSELKSAFKKIKKDRQKTHPKEKDSDTLTNFLASGAVLDFLVKKFIENLKESNTDCFSVIWKNRFKGRLNKALFFKDGDSYVEDRYDDLAGNTFFKEEYEKGIIQKYHQKKLEKEKLVVFCKKNESLKGKVPCYILYQMKMYCYDGTKLHDVELKHADLRFFPFSLKSEGEEHTPINISHYTSSLFAIQNNKDKQQCSNTNIENFIQYEEKISELETTPYIPSLKSPAHFEPNVYNMTDENRYGWAQFATRQGNIELSTAVIKDYTNQIAKVINFKNDNPLHKNRLLPPENQKKLMQYALELQLIHEEKKKQEVPQEQNQPQVLNDIVKITTTLIKYSNASFKSYARSRLFKATLQDVTNKNTYKELYDALLKAKNAALADDNLRKNIHRKGESRYLNVLNQALDQVVLAWTINSEERKGFEQFVELEKDNFIDLLKNPPLVNGCTFEQMDHLAFSAPKKPRYILKEHKIYYQGLGDQKPIEVSDNSLNILNQLGIKEGKKSTNLSAQQIETLKKNFSACVPHDLPENYRVNPEKDEKSMSQLIQQILELQRDNNWGEEMKTALTVLNQLALIIGKTKEPGAVRRFCTELQNRIPTMLQYVESKIKKPVDENFDVEQLKLN